MSRMMFVNLPVKDLHRSIGFFTALGFDFHPQFTDDNATCMIISEQVCVMLLTESRFRDFTVNDAVNAQAGTEVILAISAESREEVDDLVARALASGGKPSTETMDEGTRYGSGFQDVDGHLWEVMWTDPTRIES